MVCASPLSAALQIVKFQQGVYPTAGYAGTIDSWISSTAATTNAGGNTGDSLSMGRTMPVARIAG